MYVFIERVGMHESDSFILRIKIALDLWIVIMKLNSLIFFGFFAFVLTVFLKVSDPTSGHAVTLQGATDPPPPRDLTPH